MKVLLLDDVYNLGRAGDVKKVADGYGRNFLLPQGKAVQATPANRKMIEQQRVKFDVQIAKERGLAEELAKKLEGIVCTITAKVVEEDRLYGSISSRDIIAALAKQEITIEKRSVLLKEPIISTGAFKVPIRVYKDVEPEITVEVQPE